MTSRHLYIVLASLWAMLGTALPVARGFDALVCFGMALWMVWLARDKPFIHCSAYIAGIVQNDGEDLDGARKDDLFVVMSDTPDNRKLQTFLLRK